ncbi:peptide deformylase [Acidiphilium sp. AL]|uniref:Peptide deformylase n=1 Tax=Acidiphilium iwatense TaxID=768198 RepID=A0ABS9DW29_9PROT|nr:MULTISPECIES: peptide deformylase [Acidiphilium]MCF3945881.1 peptide deformylase [Acidiphilium iwatense]MCU4159238.1 peptide deformylase [Acidiphilium sp. AL]
MSERNEPRSDDIPPILIVPDKRLRMKARKIVPADRAEAARIIPGMFAAMYKAPGIGLAATQIGVPLRLVVLDLGPDGEPVPLVLINPEITHESVEQVTREEGCLSLPGQYADVTRPARITASFEDLEGKRHTIDADGLLAACIQHEIDHLDGILFVDHLSALKRNILLRKLAKEQREKADTGKRAL